MAYAQRRKVRSLISKADWARDQKNYEIAASLYGAALTLDSSLSAIHVQCGHMNKEVGRFALAETHYLHALALTPNDPDLHLQIGHFYKVVGRLGDAAWAYYCAAELKPGWPEPLGELCALYEADNTTFAMLKSRDSQYVVAESGPFGQVEFVTPSRWAVVGGSPIIRVRSSVEKALTIELFPLCGLRSKEILPAPTVKLNCEQDEIRNIYAATPSDWLDDGPHIIIVRAANGSPLALLAIVVEPFIEWRLSYQALVNEELVQFELDRADAEQFVREMLYQPQFLVAIEGSEEARIGETVASLKAQVYPHWMVRLFHGRAGADFLESSDFDFLIWLEEGDELRPNALFEFASAINAKPDADLHYADEDVRLPNGCAGSPFFKPDWSPDYLEVFNYIGRPACFRANIAQRSVGGEGYYDFVLRFCEYTSQIHHIRKVLCKVNRSPCERHDVNRDRLALMGRLGRTKRAGKILPLIGADFGWDIRIDLNRMPMISIILPTASRTIEYGDRAVELLPNVLSSISDRTNYSNLEVIVISNGDLKPEHKAKALALGCRLVNYEEPVFNISKKLNMGVREARGEFLVLLNDDIEIVTRSWIERMLEHFEKSHVGVVGAKLLYPSGMIQHAGVVINCGNPDHVVRCFPADQEGYFLSTCGVRNYVAVTGACMMTRRDIYLSVGGFSEDLAVSYNDIDFCQKVRAMGRSVVYAPQATLIHMESQSRTPTLDPKEAEIYQRRWASVDTVDPFYNEVGLTIQPPTFEVTFNGRYL
ncbi:glycosyltransferase [Enhydrobacter aerosaccus]|nr:glycosyltransferase [Enhydrobacter aerosaccus]